MGNVKHSMRWAVLPLCLGLLSMGAGCQSRPPGRPDARPHSGPPDRGRPSGPEAALCRLHSSPSDWGGPSDRTSAPSRPLIGITSVYEPAQKDKSAETTAGFAYAVAVAENGGVPVVLPTIDDEQVLQRYLEVLDGLVLIGGDDIPPEAYGEKPHETVQPLTKERYDFERKLIARWLAGGKPVLGVCLGMQFTNVVSGGSLMQDIPSQVGTKVNHRGYHPVRIESPSRLSQILGRQEAAVLSNHHQAVKTLGKNLRVVARSEDGVIEALERTDGPFGLFVQWHPEAMTDLAHCNAIYGALVQACVRVK